MKKVVLKPKVKAKIKEEVFKAEETPVEVMPVETMAEEVKTVEPVNEVPVLKALTRATFTYAVPETREELLALHKCLKDTGVNSIGDLEVKASRM